MMKRNARITAIVALLLLLGVVVFLATKNVNDASFTQNDDGSMELSTSEGTLTTGKELPEGWPDDAPIFAGSAIIYSAGAEPMDGTLGLAAVLETKATSKEVFDFYKTELPKQGWKLSAEMQAAGTVIFSATKDERTLSMAISETSDGTAITMTIEK